MALRTIMAMWAVWMTVLASCGAAGAGQVDDLLDAMGVPEIIEVMHDEGLDYGQELSRDLLGDEGGAAWRAEVAHIYDTAVMEGTVRAGFKDALGDHVDLAPLLAFFESPEGKRVVQLEISARQAMTDKAVEDAARAAYAGLESTGDPRLTRIEPFVIANDLIDANVTGALNSSYAFYRGLADGGGFEMSEDQIVSEVGAQERATRADTREWLYAYLMLAYGPLDDRVVAQYAALSATPAGKDMNRALFAGFDDMYADISYALGLAVSHRMLGMDL